MVLTLSDCNIRHDIAIIRDNNGKCRIKFKANRNYLLLPIEDNEDPVKLSVFVEGNLSQSIEARLARNHVDYFVPINLKKNKGEIVNIILDSCAGNAIFLRELKLSNEYVPNEGDYFRPFYHHVPEYGWMNDPNGLIYLNGEYHLFYQHNPYGSKWGNMHWGHAISRDLVNWKNLPDAIAPDSNGTVFSGCCVIDKNNTAGFGKNAIVAMYTANGCKQTQCIAYSLDKGRTFRKYINNPVLKSDKYIDFRDPKVIWHKETGKWIMVLSAGNKINFYSSADLKSWKFESSFSNCNGAHNGVWECPDLFELPVNGNKNEKRWVLLCSIFPNSPMGSATQYFVGSFDGKKFVNNSSPNVIKWMDYGKDFYATSTWDNLPDGRCVAIAWMSNVAYANDVPTKYFRGINSLPRQLSLNRSDYDIYLASVPCQELNLLRNQRKILNPFIVSSECNIPSILSYNKGAFELNLDFENINAEVYGFKLFNTFGESIDFNINSVEMILTLDRSKSTISKFNSNFASIINIPINKIKCKNSLRVFIDKSSIEIFINNGEVALTNLIYPQEPFNRISFISKGGSFKVNKFEIYNLKKSNR